MPPSFSVIPKTQSLQCNYSYALINKHLIIPEKWFLPEYKVRQEKCKFPETSNLKGHFHELCCWSRCHYPERLQLKWISVTDGYPLRWSNGRWVAIRKTVTPESDCWNDSYTGKESKKKKGLKAKEQVWQASRRLLLSKGDGFKKWPSGSQAMFILVFACALG